MPGGLDEFRVAAAREIGLILKRLCDANAQLSLTAGPEATVATTLWAVDSARGSISFSIDPNDPNLAPLLESDEAIAVGYLDNVKLQFDVQGLVLVRGARASVLGCAWPRELFRFQRRGAYRVRPLLRASPSARLRHSEIAEMRLCLRVLDLSIGGCALFLPDDVPALQPGVVLNQVLIELDDDTRFTTDLRLQHITSMNSDARGVRLGCEFVHAGGDAQRALQRFIDQTQKRSKLLAPG
jgi:c-di-GMP-binding flagellar brake protein YcgR